MPHLRLRRNKKNRSSGAAAAASFSDDEADGLVVEEVVNDTTTHSSSTFSATSLSFSCKTARNTKDNNADAAAITGSGCSNNNKNKVFYVNCHVLDATGGVYDQVQEKVSNATSIPGTKKFRKKLANTVANIVSEKVPPKVVAEKLANRIPKALRYKLHQKGISVSAETVFLEDCYVVVQLSVIHTDTVKLAQSIADDLEKKAATAASSSSSSRRKKRITTTIGNNNDDDDDDDYEDYNDDDYYYDNDDDDSSVATSVLDAWIEEQEAFEQQQRQKRQEQQQQQSTPFSSAAPSRTNENDRYAVTARLDSLDPSNPRIRKSRCAKWIAWLWSWISHKSRHTIESRYLPNLIISQITSKMDDMFRKKMQQKNVVADTVILLEEAQARYFFSKLKEIRQTNNKLDNKKQ